MLIKTLYIIIYFFNINGINVCICGKFDFNDSLGRLPIGLVENLNKNINQFVVPINKCDDYIDKNKLNKYNNQEIDISILFEHLWYSNNLEPYKYIPKNSKIKIAYSMIESTSIPKEWVDIINSAIDLVVVPDKFLINVYKESGVIKPILVLPCGLYLMNFLNNKSIKENAKKNNNNNTFIFGSSTQFMPWKNNEKLVESFIEEFNKDENIKLIIHGRTGYELSKVKQIINQKKAENIVTIINQKLEFDELLKLYDSFDAYIIASKGEGFSITPRELIAMGKPVIITNNTAHKTICDAGVVTPIRSNIEAPIYYDAFGQFCGTNFDCEKDDIKKALRFVFNNYNELLKTNDYKKKWVMQYDWSIIKDKYNTLLNPKKIIYGTKNQILDKGLLMLSDKNLVKKFSKIIYSASI